MGKFPTFDWKWKLGHCGFSFFRWVRHFFTLKMTCRNVSHSQHQFTLSQSQFLPTNARYWILVLWKTPQSLLLSVSYLSGKGAWGNHIVCCTLWREHILLGRAFLLMSQLVFIIWPNYAQMFSMQTLEKVYVGQWIVSFSSLKLTKVMLPQISS